MGDRNLVKKFLFMWILIVGIIFLGNLFALSIYEYKAVKAESDVSSGFNIVRTVTTCFRDAVNDENGNLLYYKKDLCSTKHNILTNIFANFTRDILRGASNQSVSQNISIGVIALSTNTVAATGTESTCPSMIDNTNGLGPRAAGTVVTVGLQGNYTLYQIFTSTGGTTAVRTICIMNATNNVFPSLMGIVVTSSASNMEINDQYTVNASTAVTGTG